MLDGIQLTTPSACLQPPHHKHMSDALNHNVAMPTMSPSGRKFQLYCDFTGPLSYTQSLMNPNVLMQCVTVLKSVLFQG